MKDGQAKAVFWGVEGESCGLVSPKHSYQPEQKHLQSENCRWKPTDACCYALA